MYFSYQSLLRPDYTFTETADEGRVHVGEFTSGIAGLLANCDSRASDLYVHYSHPSIHGAFITGGETLFDANRDGWLKAIEDLGMQIQFVSYEQVEQGKLVEDMPRAVLLPYSLAVSDEEAAAFEAYVNAGGVLIADARCGLMDEHCRTRETAALDGLFGVSRSSVDPRAKRPEGEVSFYETWRGCDLTGLDLTALGGDAMLATTEGAALGTHEQTPILIVRNVGKGHTVLTNLFMDSYVRRRTLGIEEPLTRLVSEVLGIAGIGPYVTTESTQPGHFYIARFKQAEATYVGILREPPTVQTGGGPGSASTGTTARNALVKSSFPDEMHVYDVRAGEYVGKSDAAERLLQPGECALYSLLPYEVTGVEVQPRGRARRQGGPVGYEIALQTAGAVEPGMHVVRVEVAGPDGLREHYGTQLVFDGGSTEGEFVLALNDTIGTWMITATDIATGVVGEAEFEVVER
jgi:hypothetical protein